jgi:hypothetical protein
MYALEVIRLLTDEEIKNGKAGLLLTASGNLSKVQIFDGELVNCYFDGMKAKVFFDGKIYDVKGSKLFTEE